MRRVARAAFPRGPLRFYAVPPRLDSQLRSRNRNLAYSLTALVVFGVGASYAAVPLYRMFCRVTGYGDQPVFGPGGKVMQDEFAKQTKNEGRPFKVLFNTDVSFDLPWSFRALQNEVTVLPGAPMLAFFRAKNNSDHPIVGVSTYHVTPSKATPYFVKIQCFCFEEQMLAPREEVDMPVFFYIDPEILDDPRFNNLSELTLSYTFFLSKGRNEAFVKSAAAPVPVGAAKAAQ